MSTIASSLNLEVRLGDRLEHPAPLQCQYLAVVHLPFWNQQVDAYPTSCATLPKEQAYSLARRPTFVSPALGFVTCEAGILVKNLTQKKFDRYWDMIDVDKKEGTAPTVRHPFFCCESHCFTLFHRGLSPLMTSANCWTSKRCLKRSCKSAPLRLTILPSPGLTLSPAALALKSKRNIGHRSLFFLNGGRLMKWQA